MQFALLYISEQTQKKKRTEKFNYCLDEKRRKIDEKTIKYQMDFWRSNPTFSVSIKKIDSYIGIDLSNAYQCRLVSKLFFCSTVVLWFCVFSSFSVSFQFGWFLITSYSISLFLCHLSFIYVLTFVSVSFRSSIYLFDCFWWCSSFLMFFFFFDWYGTRQC